MSLTLRKTSRKEKIASEQDYVYLPSLNRIFDLTEQNFPQVNSILEEILSKGYLYFFDEYIRHSSTPYTKRHSSLKCNGFKKYDEGFYLEFEKIHALQTDEDKQVVLPLGFSRFPKFAFLETKNTNENYERNYGSLCGEVIGGLYFSIGMSAKNPFAFREEVIYSYPGIISYTPEANIRNVNIGTSKNPDVITEITSIKNSWRKKAIS